MADRIHDSEHLDKVLEALKASGVVIPNDLSLPAKVSSEMSKEGIRISPQIGGLAFSHYFIVWDS